MDQQGKPLAWTYSKTIEYVLIDKHQPPLAENAGNYRGYQITDRGRDFYFARYDTKKIALPGEDHATMADFLFGHVDDGALLRRLHPEATGEPAGGGVAV